MTGFRLGDHLIAEDIFYTHHGIYIDEAVIHLVKFNNLQITTVENFAGGRAVKVIPHPDTDPKRTVERAFDLMLHHHIHYHLLLFNCESFVMAALG